MSDPDVIKQKRLFEKFETDMKKRTRIKGE